MFLTKLNFEQFIVWIILYYFSYMDKLLWLEMSVWHKLIPNGHKFDQTNAYTDVKVHLHCTRRKQQSKIA